MSPPSSSAADALSAAPHRRARALGALGRRDDFVDAASDSVIASSWIGETEILGLRRWPTRPNPNPNRPAAAATV